MNRLLFLLIALLFASCSSSNDVENNERIVLEDLQDMLTKNHLSGVVLIFDEVENRYYSNDFEASELSALPASTFKIANTIIGLETGVLENANSVFKWNGEPRYLPSWEADLTVREAFHLSCVPCYQKLARQIGLDRMQENLTQLQFGEIDVTEDNLDRFWLVGDSKINAMQQIDFLRRLKNKELPITAKTHQEIINILKIEESDSQTLSGKTGLAVFDHAKDIGWFVGYLEKEGKTYYFATQVTPSNDMLRADFIPLRKEVTMQALKRLSDSL